MTPPMPANEDRRKITVMTNSTAELYELHGAAADARESLSEYMLNAGLARAAGGIWIGMPLARHLLTAAQKAGFSDVASWLTDLLLSRP